MITKSEVFNRIPSLAVFKKKYAAFCFFSVICLSLFVTSCRDDDDAHGIIGEAEITFLAIAKDSGNGNPPTNDVSAGARITSEDEDLSSIVVTMLDAVTGDTILKDEILSLTRFGSGFATDPILVPAQRAYVVHKFMILNSSNEAKYSAVKRGAPFSEFVDEESLIPIYVDALNANDEIGLEIEVLGITEFSNPNDFGFISFIPSRVDLTDFLLAVFVQGDSRMELADANLTISSEGQIIKEEALKAQVNYVVTRSSSSLELTVSKVGYSDFKETYTIKELAGFLEDPLVVYLEKGHTIGIPFDLHQSLPGVVGAHVEAFSNNGGTYFLVTGDGPSTIHKMNSSLSFEYLQEIAVGMPTRSAAVVGYNDEHVLLLVNMVAYTGTSLGNVLGSGLEVYGLRNDGLYEQKQTYFWNTPIYGIEVGAITNDITPDIALATFAGNDNLWMQGVGTQKYHYIEKTIPGILGTWSYTPVIGEVGAADGFGEIVYGNHPFHPIQIYRNSSNSFSEANSFTASNGGETLPGIDLGDLDQDGFNDLVIASHEGGSANRILFGNASGFDIGQPMIMDYIRGLNPEVLINDLNSDGLPDYIISHTGLENTVMFINKGDRTFWKYEIPIAQTTSVAVIDFNNDGRKDLITTSLSEVGTNIWLGNGNW